MSRSEWDDDAYDAAPLPAHERPWRHPSEMGQEAWVMSEPPLAIGRGLTVATGTIGCMLALAVLWTMLPTQAGRSAQSSVRSTLANRTDGLTDRTDGTVASSAAAAVTTDRTEATDSVASSFAGATSQPDDTGTSAGPSTVPAPVVVPTYQVRKGAEVTETAIAVAVQGGNLIITTAEAVSADLTVSLMLPGGELATAQVLFVDDRSGLAVLAPETATGAMAFPVASEVVAGDQLTFYGEEPSTVTVSDDLTIPSAWTADPSIAEGTPVVNQNGELVALCSHDAEGTGRLVQLGNLDQLQQAITPSTSATVWLGVVLNDDPSGKLSIGAVDPAGPAAAAGLSSGDVIVSIDDAAVSTNQALSDALATHVPGDVVQFVVQRNGATTTVTVTVTLAAPKTSV